VEGPRWPDILTVTGGRGSGSAAWRSTPRPAAVVRRTTPGSARRLPPAHARLAGASRVSGRGHRPGGGGGGHVERGWRGRRDPAGELRTVPGRRRGRAVRPSGRPRPAQGVGPAAPGLPGRPACGEYGSFCCELSSAW